MVIGCAHRIIIYQMCGCVICIQFAVLQMMLQHWIVIQIGVVVVAGSTAEHGHQVDDEAKGNEASGHHAPGAPPWRSRGWSVETTEIQKKKMGL